MRPKLDTMPKVIIGLLCIWLSVSAILPLFGYNIIAAELMTLEHFNPQRENYYLYVVRSATFMMLAFFGLNYLRRRRPLSSVAPLLVYVNFVILFGFLYQLLSFSFVLNYWLALGLLFPVSFWLYRQNISENRKRSSPMIGSLDKLYGLGTWNVTNGEKYIGRHKKLADMDKAPSHCLRKKRVLWNLKIRG